MHQHGSNGWARLLSRLPDIACHLHFQQQLGADSQRLMKTQRNIGRERLMAVDDARQGSASDAEVSSQLCKGNGSAFLFESVQMLLNRLAWVGGVEPLRLFCLANEAD